MKFGKFTPWNEIRRKPHEFHFGNGYGGIVIRASKGCINWK